MNKDMEKSSVHSQVYLGRVSPAVHVSTYVSCWIQALQQEASGLLALAMCA